MGQASLHRHGIREWMELPMKKCLRGMAVLDFCLVLVFAMLWVKRAETSGMVREAFLEASGSIVREDAAKGRNVREDAAKNQYNEDGPKKIALTFDDGPHPTYTSELLDGLKERGVQATFFVTGEHAELHPDVIKRMQEEGHLIGNHTYSHVQLRSSNKKSFKEELQKTNGILYDITGQEVLYVRPPYGSWDRTLERELNMFPVFWTIDPTDWSCLNAETVTRRVVKKAKENAIILLHDYYPTSVEAAFRIIDELQAEGYKFVTVDQILTE